MGDTLRALSPHYAGPPAIARMLIASEVTETDTVRATTFDTLASDTGAYTITTQSCKVPVPPLVQPTDSITHTDTFGAISGVEYTDTATTHTIDDFSASNAGHYTFVVAASAPASYTLTIGTEQPVTALARFSRSRSRPLVVQRQSTPPSVMRRGR